MTKVTYEKLAEATTAFFARHWISEDLGPCPTWQHWDEFLQGSVPNHQHPGCYAVFFGSELRYVGLGASLGGGSYKEHGISRRLMANVIQADRLRGPVWSKLRERFTGATDIYTLGLPNTSYLAAALETYLIRCLQPPMNKRV